LDAHQFVICVIKVSYEPVRHFSVKRFKNSHAPLPLSYLKLVPALYLLLSYRLGGQLSMTEVSFTVPLGSLPITIYFEYSI
jgi:hypothetical protein